MADDGEKMDVTGKEENVSVPQEGDSTSEFVKPLTEEEKTERLRRAEERIKQRKLEIQEEERKRQIEHEKSRRREGQDLGKIKADIQWREAQKLAAERKLEMKEDRLVRQRVLDEIAQDRVNMKARHATSEHVTVQSSHDAEKDERQRIKEAIAQDRENVRAQKEPSMQEHAENSGTNTASVGPPSVQKNYTEAKLQIRLPSNTKLVQTFGADEPLSAVRLYIDINSQGELGPFVDLSRPYPRKVFTDDEMQMSLRVLGLAPNAVLLANRGKDPGSGTAI